MILPLTNAPVIGYQHHAYRLSIMALHADFDAWLYCNYIQLILVKKAHHMPKVDFYEFEKWSPLMGEMYLMKSMIHPYVPLTTYLKDRIDERRYVVTFVNEYYVPGRIYYRKHHNVHDIMIYGYDEDKEVFYTAGYNDKLVYATQEVSYAHMADALMNIHGSKGELHRWAEGVHLLDLASEQHYTFDLPILLEQLREYRYARNSSLRYRMHKNAADYVYGIDIYDEITTYLQHVKQHMIDVRLFHILYEHKTVMKRRIRYLVDDVRIALPAYMIAEYEKIVEDAKQLRHLCIRMSMKVERETAYQMIILLQDIKKKETVWLDDLIHELEKCHAPEETFMRNGRKG